MPFMTTETQDIDLATDEAGNRTLYQVPEANYPQFVKDIAKLSKRAMKLVDQPIDIMKVGERVMVLKAGEPAMRVFDVFLMAPAPIVGDLAFVATIDHTNETGNIIRTVPNFRCELPEKYRSVEPLCDHCGVKRMRRDTYVLWNAHRNEFQQVGSSCLEAALGHNPFAAAKMAELLGYADEIAKANREPVGNAYMNDYRWLNVENFLNHVARTIRLHGWVSGRRAYETNGRSTRHRAEEYMMDHRDDITFSDKDTALASAALEWARGLRDGDAPLNEYLHNIAVVAGSEYVEFRSAGLAASIIAAYQTSSTPRLDKRNSQHVGKIGDRVKAPCKVIGVSGKDSDFGYTNIYRFMSESGNVVVWFTTTSQDIHYGDKVVLTGTVKKHGEFQGVKETTLTRCKAEPC